MERAKEVWGGKDPSTPHTDAIIFTWADSVHGTAQYANQWSQAELLPSWTSWPGIKGSWSSKQGQQGPLPNPDPVGITQHSLK